MKHNCETLSDDNGIEINVGYDYEDSPIQIEEGHGFHEVGNLVYTELKTVEVVIAKSGIDILPFLNDKQKSFIFSKLSYE
jgi:hypothetical protein